ASFANLAGAAEAVVAISRTLRPAMLELMDRASINAVEDFVSMGLDRGAGGLLVAQSDAGAGAPAELAAMQAACTAAGATEVYATSDPVEGEAFAAARRSAFPAIEKRGSLMLEDVGVAVPLLPALLAGIEQIAARNRVEIPTVAHAGDGNTHPIVVYDATDPESVANAKVAFGEIMRLALKLGGTITGEHGVGRLKKAYLPEQLGPDVLALTQRIKDALDPLGILNPGAVL
ncbi:MAG TPA: FAD-linked oxidase C-terminal domain-containing protein, partial [Jatrophihabitans sp.]|nr:FAD-linked oxidase C-terminal domain-containing protein [Jatrophihabitans sp.]